MLFRLCRLWPASHISLITSLEIEFDNWPEAKKWGHGSLYGELFQLLSSAVFRHLQSLEIMLGILPLAWYPPFLSSPGWESHPFTEEEETGWVGPWERLLASRRLNRFVVAVPREWGPCFQELVRKRAGLQADVFKLTADFDKPDPLERVMIPECR